jgi:hypothetical protein
MEVIPMEEGKFNELLRALRLLKLSGDKDVDIVQFAGMNDLTPEQKSQLINEFRERKMERTSPVYFEEDYF